MYHQGENKLGPRYNVKIEDWGYGMIAHNYLWNHYLNNTPKYSGKFGLIDKTSYKKQSKKSPTWKDKSYYFGKTALNSLIRKLK